MRIALDFGFISRGPSWVNRGKGRFIQQQLREVLKQDQKNEYLLLCAAEATPGLLLSEIQAAPNARLVHKPWERQIVPVNTRQMEASVLENSARFQDWLRQLDVDLYHATIPFDSEQWPMPDFDVCPFVANFFDTIPLIYPDKFLPQNSPAESHYHLTLTFLKKASALIAISESARRHAHQFIGLAPEKIHLACPAPDPAFRHLHRFSGTALGRTTRDVFFRAAERPQHPSPNRKRLAFWTPLPPLLTGISDYSLELLRELRRDYDIEIFVDGGYLPSPALFGRYTIHHYGSFESRHQARPFDLVIYQLGASLSHLYMKDAAERWPGLAVVHDLSWGHMLRAYYLEDDRPAEFESELERQEGASARLTYQKINHPQNSQSEKRVEDFLDQNYLLGKIVRNSRAVAVHLEHSRKALAKHYPGANVQIVPHGGKDSREGIGGGFRARARFWYHLDSSTFVVGTFGIGNRIRRLDSLLRAFAQFRRRHPDSLLVMVGRIPDNWYSSELRILIQELGLKSSVRLIREVNDTEFTAWMETCDVVVNLRHPSRQQMSGVACRALAAGKPLLMTDLPEWSIFPDAICWKIPAPDGEIPALVESLEKLASDPELRTKLGKSSRELYLRSFHPTVAAAEYRRIIEEILTVSAPER